MDKANLLLDVLTPLHLKNVQIGYVLLQDKLVDKFIT